MIFCVTGKMAAGKNFICSKMVREDKNLAAIDLDQTAHTAINLVQDKIFSCFGEEAKKLGLELKNQDGSLNRRALGKLLFSEPALLKKHESIVYPKVIELTKNFIAESQSNGKSVLINAAVLYKTPELMELCEKIYFVTASLPKRLVRAKRRDKMPLAQIISRFKSQRNLLSEYRKTGKEIIIVRN